MPLQMERPSPLKEGPVRRTPSEVRQMRIDKNNYEAFFLDYFEGTLSAERVAELMLFLEQHPELKKEFDEYENISLNDIEDEIKFENKDQLKKETISAANFEEIAISYIERKLTAEEETALFAFIEKNPEYKPQLELFRKTILTDEKIIFENRAGLKKQVESLSEKEMLLLAAVEGNINAVQQKELDLIIASDKGIKEELSALKRTKLPIDGSIVFPNKNSLKRRETRVIPFYYYVAAAASIALLIGFYFLSGNEQLKGDQLSFNKKSNIIKLHLAPQDTLSIPFIIANSKEKKWKNNNIILPNDKVNNKKENEIRKDNEQDEPILVKNEIKTHDTITNKDVIVKNDHPVNANDQNILVNSFNDQDDQPLKKNDEYLSLGQTLAFKMKDKMLKDEMSDKSTYKEDKKRITWYDAVLLTMKGIRSLTGREVDVRKKYNDKNELVAYQYTVGNRTFTKALGKKSS